MKKIILFFTLMFLTVNIFSFSDQVLRTKKLPSKKEFKSQYALFQENEKFSDHWSQKWEYEKSKDDVIRELKDFDSYLDTLKENYEIKLLGLLVKSYLYNLDGIHFDQVVEYGTSLKEKYPKEYRTWWLMGNFYSGASLNYIYPEYEKAVEMRGGIGIKDEWAVPFLYSYIYGCNMAGMKIHARWALDYYCQFTGTKPEDFYLYNILFSNQAASSVDENYDMYDTWLFGQTEKETRIFSTLLGLSIPVNPNWQMRANGYENGRAFVSLSSDPIAISETATTHVTFSVFAFAKVDKNYMDTIVNNSITRYEGTIVKKETRTYNGIIADYYDYENDSIYNDERKGMKGVSIVLAVPYNEFSGISFEHPIDYNANKASGQTEDGMSYWAMKPNLNRLQTTVYFMINLDACKACFDQAEEWMNSILDGCIFE